MGSKNDDLPTITGNNNEESIEDKPQTPLPWMQVILVCAMVFSDTFSRAVIYPFIPFLVYSMGKTDSITHVGFYVCYVEACMSLGQFCSSFVWGYISDKYSRKAVMLIGTFGSGVAMGLFGFAFSYPFILGMRFLGGLFNGGVDGVGKSHLADITDETNQAKAFALLGPAEGLGLIIGPVFGGLLARPAYNYPNVFPQGGFFDEYPYVLACSVSAVLMILESFIAAFLLKDSRKKSAEETPILEAPSPKLVNTSKNYRAPTPVRIDDVDENGSPIQDSAVSEKPKMTLKEILKFIISDFKVMGPVIMYALLSFCSTVLVESLPLYVINPIEVGGFGWEERQIGIMLAVIGVSVVPYQVWIYPWLARKLGPLVMFRFAIGAIIPMLLLFPCVSFLTFSVELTWTGAIVVLAFAIWMVVSSNTSVFLLINNSVYSEMRGSANGVAQTVNAAARTFGPLTGGNLIAWSFTNGLPFPLNRFFLFEVLSLLLVIVEIIALKLPKTLDWKRETNDVRSASQSRSASPTNF